MKLLYCDTCFLINLYQDECLDVLSQYKDQFYISETQIKDELTRPVELAQMARKSVTVIKEDRDEIIFKAKELNELYQGLSLYDCLCMSYCLLDGYSLVTDDKALIKKCNVNNIITKTSRQIEIEFKLYEKSES